MSTALNDRDAILQAASVRIINPKNASILLNASSSLFHLNAAGAVDVATITITATLVGLEGDVTFTADGAALTNVTGKSAVVRYADMQGPAAIVTARIVAGGQTFSQSCIIVVVRDGADGSDGGSGARGAGMYFASGNAWSDGTADAATPGGNVVGDVVTISNGSTYSLTKRWSGAEWLAMGAVFDGSLFVTGSINGAALKVGTVEIRKPDGTLILGAGGTLAAEAAAPGTKNSEIVVGGRNLFPDGDFERGFHQLRGAVGGVSTISNAVGAISGAKSLFIEGSGADMNVYLGTRISVTPGREYRISFYSKSATNGVVTGSSSYILLFNSAGAPSAHTILPMDNLGVGTWKRQVVAWTCPPDITQIEPRFGITTNSVYSWLAIDCVQIEEGNTVTQWSPATEDIAADAQAKADASRTAAQVYATEQINLANVTTRAYADGKVTAEEQRAIADATAKAEAARVAAVNAAAADATGKANAARDAAIADANAKLAAKMNRGNDVLGGVIAVDAVNAPAGFRAGPLSWNAAGDYTSGYGTAMTPKGLIAYNQAGQRTFMVNGQTGDVSIRGALMGGSFTGWEWPANGAGGFILEGRGLLMGNRTINRYANIEANGDMYMPGFSHVNGQLTLDNTILINPKLNAKSASITSTGGTYFTSSRNNPSAYMGSHRMDTAGFVAVKYAWSVSYDAPPATFSARAGSDGTISTTVNAAVSGLVGQAFDVRVSCIAFDSGGLSVSASTTITLEIT